MTGFFVIIALPLQVFLIAMLRCLLPQTYFTARRISLGFSMSSSHVCSNAMC